MLQTTMGSEIVLTGKVMLGINDGKPELMLECHLASGDAGKIHLSVNSIVADGGFAEVQEAVRESQKKLHDPTQEQPSKEDTITAKTYWHVRKEQLIGGPFKDLNSAETQKEGLPGPIISSTKIGVSEMTVKILD